MAECVERNGYPASILMYIMLVAPGLARKAESIAKKRTDQLSGAYPA